MGGVGGVGSVGTWVHGWHESNFGVVAWVHEILAWVKKLTWVAWVEILALVA